MIFLLQSALCSSWMFAVVSSTGRIAAISLGVVAALIAVVLFIASRSKWGENKPLTKCIALAVVAHVWLLMYAYGTRIQRPGMGEGSGSGYPSQSFEMLDMSFVEMDEVALNAPTTLEPELEPPLPLPPQQELLAKESNPIQPDIVDTASQISEAESLPESLVTKPTGIEADISSMPSPFETQQGNERDLPPDVESQSIRHDTAPTFTTTEASQIRSVGRVAVQVPMKRRALDQQLVPEIYQLRLSESRSSIAGQLGGDGSTEAAVEAALGYLVSIQEADGAWDAERNAGGREQRMQDRDRRTGAKADTGMSALALLSFLGAGYTHDRGPYTQTVANGLGYLIAAQMPSGDLAGPKQIGSSSDVRFARMYCHGMATLALAEAYAMTGDPRLKDPVERAAAYTLRAQNPQTGGWRYQSQITGDPGDLSQFGWQAMGLKSCEQAGIILPTGTHSKMTRFLDSVSAGRSGGLAVYRPVPGQSPTTAMTAEALALRMLLQYPLSTTAQQEANGYLLQNLPGQSEENYYYWYYATLALFHQQDDTWRLWNEAMKTHITRTQVTSGPTTGSWDPRCVWAGYGGRIYNTTMACLCLEVYYRYLPIYQNGRMANQPNSGWR
ncbi:MAG: prenyltransferase/squalene oxidase repeat-containing protein [Pirellulaceae bacterium]|nr:prenyltransferase/squalene oxidase repeat-containing protein [Pirellulaceae bacterium]